MSGDAGPNHADLKSQYAERLDADLEGNAKEQDRISSEIATLQERLSVLEGDRALLLSMRQAISDGRPADRRRGNEGDKAKRKGGSRAGAGSPRRDTAKAARKGNDAKPAASSERDKNTSPVLRVLAVEELAKHSQPRSAAEVTSALAQAYPERRFIDQVVRNTLENLVARGEVQRIKQQRSVFYTMLDSAAAKGQAARSGRTAAAV
ncbi:hypothetical protein [Streptomyces sp. NBC_00005]|uniref:hypothetical protein n=1 Tax=Streptomyces sp. NBC_00005 TaxID=2903609 RepID=UPI00324838F9